MHRLPSRPARTDRGQRGQILIIAAMAMIALIGGVSLVLEGGNAYAHQRIAQNAADSVANAGAAVLAKRLSGQPVGDTEVLGAIDLMGDENGLNSYTGYYTNLYGELLTPAGLTTTTQSAAAEVGPGSDGDITIPAGAQGVQVVGSQAFGTTFARVDRDQPVHRVGDGHGGDRCPDRRNVPAGGLSGQHGQLRRLGQHGRRRRAVADEQPQPRRSDRSSDRAGVHRPPVQDGQPARS